MHHRILMHIVWATRDRERTIDCVRAAYLWEHLPIIARQERSAILELAVVANHLHMLVRLHPTTLLPRMLQRMKGGTAHRINEANSAARRLLRWGKGYSATTVSPRDLERVATYVRLQHLHHPDDVIPGWNHCPVASATSAEPRLSAARAAVRRSRAPLI